MGVTFKENCPDLRNSRVIDLIEGFKNFTANINVYDPWADKGSALREYGVSLIESPSKNDYDVIVLAVGHSQFKELTTKELRSFGKERHILYDALSHLFP